MFWSGLYIRKAAAIDSSSGNLPGIFRSRRKAQQELVQELSSKLDDANKTIASLMRDNQMLSQQARTDQITELGNKRKFGEDLAKAEHLWLRHGLHFAVMFIDMDGLKAINDTAGHDAGNEAILSMAKVLKANIRDEDGTVYRWGGDEFVAILSGVDTEKAEYVAGRLVGILKANGVKATCGVAGTKQGMGEGVGELLFSEADNIVNAKKPRRQERQA